MGCQLAKDNGQKWTLHYYWLSYKLIRIKIVDILERRGGQFWREARLQSNRYRCALFERWIWLWALIIIVVIVAYLVRKRFMCSLVVVVCVCVNSFVNSFCGFLCSVSFCRDYLENKWQYFSDNNTIFILWIQCSFFAARPIESIRILFSVITSTHTLYYIYNFP